MKTFFEDPKLHIVLFDLADVLTASGGDSESEDPDPGDNGLPFTPKS